MAVGDVNSTEKGSAARYNDGKDPLEQIPIRIWYYRWDNLEPWMSGALYHLAKYQEGDIKHDGQLHEAVMCVPEDKWAEASHVFQYGADKYAQWNWTKGQPWMVTLGCLLRHARAVQEGEFTDPESKQSHDGHFVCNLVMLWWFSEFYKEGAEGFFI